MCSCYLLFVKSIRLYQIFVRSNNQETWWKFDRSQYTSHSIPDFEQLQGTWTPLHRFCVYHKLSPVKITAPTTINTFRRLMQCTTSSKNQSKQSAREEKDFVWKAKNLTFIGLPGTRMRTKFYTIFTMTLQSFFYERCRMRRAERKKITSRINENRMFFRLSAFCDTIDRQ